MSKTSAKITHDKNSFPFPGISYTVRALLVALLFSAVLGSMIYKRVTLLNGGREITLRSVPIDPRDLLRGDYVILRYDISRIDTRILPTTATDDFKVNQKVFVTLEKQSSGEKQDSGFWQAIALSEQSPEKKLSENQIIIAAYIRRAYFPRAYTRRAKDAPPPQACANICQIVDLRYGIEKFFVPEGEGIALENHRDKKNLGVIVKISAHGEAAISGLQIEGKKIYNQPLF